MAHKDVEPIARSELVELDGEPSADWGWHGHFPRATRISGWVVIVFLLAMITVDRLGHISEIYLIALAVLSALVLVGDATQRRRSWRHR